MSMNKCFRGISNLNRKQQEQDTLSSQKEPPRRQGVVMFEERGKNNSLTSTLDDGCEEFLSQAVQMIDKTTALEQ